MKKIRLDQVLIGNKTVENKEEAFIAVTEGRIFVDGQKAISPAQLVLPGAKTEDKGRREYVGRGAYKLIGALDEFKIDVKDKICADVGSATGGFSEVLLKRGAAKVYAIDTARGKLDPKIRDNPNVVVMEGKDVRDIPELPDAIDIAVMDVSLLPLENLLPSVRRFLKLNGSVVALFKPQYQTRDPKILHHGVIKDPEKREELLENFLQWAEERDWDIKGTMESPIKGSEGNTEYLIHLKLKR